MIHPTNKLERLKLRNKNAKEKPSPIRRAKEKEILDDINAEASADIQSYRDSH